MLGDFKFTPASSDLPGAVLGKLIASQLGSFVGDTIVLNTLRYSDEIRESDELKIPSSSAKAAAISDKELKMAMALVEGMSEDWKPEHYHDTYREDVLALVEAKVKAKETKAITMPGKDKAPASSGNVIDLVALLQQSLGGGGKKPAKAAAANDEDDGEDADSKPAPKKRAPAKAAVKPAAKSSKTAPPAKVATTRRKSA